MKLHRLDPLSLLFGVATVIAGIAAVSGRLGNLVNDRPDALIPLVVLAAGLLVVATAARRSLQDVDRPGDDQHDRAE